MPSPQARRGGGDVDIKGNDVDWQSSAEIKDKIDGVVAASGGSDEAFGRGGGRHRKPVSSIERLGDAPASGWVMRVVSVEEPDQDPGVEVDQRHSVRRSSSSSVL